MSASKLKPCPFCGGTKVSSFFLNRMATHRNHPFVLCHGCSAKINGDDNDFSYTAETAVKAWNRRADLQPTDAEVLAHPKVKALVEVLEKVKTDLQYSEQWVAIQEIDAALAVIQEDKK